MFESKQVSSTNQLVDLFTKPLGTSHVQFICDKLCVYDIYTTNWEGVLCNKCKEDFYAKRSTDIIQIKEMRWISHLHNFPNKPLTPTLSLINIIYHKLSCFENMNN